MKHYLLPVIALGLGFCSLSSCGSSDESETVALSEFYSSLKPAKSLAGAQVPIFKAPAYAAKWGEPKVGLSAAGDYELSYANPSQPFDRLVVYGSVKPFPKFAKAPKMSGEKMINGELSAVEVSQEFRTVVIAGQNVNWYQESLSGGADGAYYSTAGFSLTDASGKTGYYRMVVEYGDDAEAEVAKRFSSGKLEK